MHEPIDLSCTVAIAEPTMRPKGRAWRVVVASMVALIVSTAGISSYTQGLFLQPMISSLGWTRNEYYLGAIATGISAVAVTPLIGLLIDRLGVRRVLVGGILLFAAANAWLGLIGPSLPVYLLVTAFIAVGGVIQSPLPYAKAIVTWFDDRRGLALAIALCGVGLGGILIPPLAAWTLAAFGWRAARIGLAVLVVLVALPMVLLFVREADPTETARFPQQDSAAAEGVALAEALRTPTLWLLAIAFMLSGATLYGILGNLIPLLSQKGVSAALSASALSIMGAAQVAGRLASGALLDFSRTPRIAVVWFLLSAAGALVLRQGDQAPALLLGSLLLGLGLGAELEIASYVVSRFFGLRYFGSIYGIVFTALISGTTTGPLVMSVIAGPDYGRALLAGAAALIVASSLLFFCGRYRFVGPSGLLGGRLGMQRS
jgi:predicted MFS family arabinose efflux permease